MTKKRVTFRMRQKDVTWLKLIAEDRKCTQISLVTQGLDKVIKCYIKELPIEIINKVLDEIQSNKNILKDGEL